MTFFGFCFLGFCFLGFCFLVLSFVFAFWPAFPSGSQASVAGKFAINRRWFATLNLAPKISIFHVAKS